MSVRLATQSDIPWIAALALRAYAGHIKEAGSVERWLAGALRNPDVLVLRSDDAVAVAALQRYFYDPQPEVRVLYLIGERVPWQIIRLLRAIVAWGKRLGCTVLGGRDNLGRDFGPLMRRLGIVTEQRLYTVQI